MADLNAKIIPLQTEVEGRVPTDAQIDVGEIAINLTDKKIYSKNAAGEVVVLGAGADDDDDSSGGLPGGGYASDDDGVPIPLADGDALRYDGEFWRPVPFQLTSLDDVVGERDYPIEWINQSLANVQSGMSPGMSYTDTNGVSIGIHPQGYIDGQLVDIRKGMEKWIAQRTGLNVSSPTLNGSWTFSPFETIVNLDGKNYPVSVDRFRNRRNASSSYDPRFTLRFTALPEEFLNRTGPVIRFPEFEEVYLASNGDYGNVSIADNAVLQWSQKIGKWDARQLIFELQKAADFSYRQDAPVTPSWTSGDSANPAEYEGTAATWILNLQAVDGTDRSQLFTDNADAAAIWWSADGASFTKDDTVVSVTKDGTAVTITFETAAPTPPSTLFIAFGEPGVLTDQPIRPGDILVYNGNQFVPADALGALDVGLTNLNDVNTVTNPPTDGQALVWDSANNVWKPGSVASETEVALDDLTDVTITSPATGQVVKYTGSGFENSALDYSEIVNAPDGVSSIGDLSDVDVSLAPVIGQVLVWDGTAWKPADQSGGGGGGGTVAGALTERADVTSGVTLDAGSQGDLLFSGLGEAGSFVQVTVNVPSWVRFYPTSGLRAGDATRPIGSDPLPGSGVLLELRTETPNETLVITPGAIYYNNDLLPDQALYARVQNQGDSTALVNVTVRAFTQTDTDTISGGTFGSG